MHLASVLLHLQGELGGDPALAHPGLAHDHGDEELSLGDAMPQFAQASPLRVSSDERRRISQQLQGGRKRSRRRLVRRATGSPDLGQLPTSCHPEFAHQRGHVTFHRSYRHVQPRGDLGVAQPLTQRLQDFDLASRHPVALQRRWRGRADACRRPSTSHLRKYRAVVVTLRRTGGSRIRSFHGCRSRRDGPRLFRLREQNGGRCPRPEAPAPPVQGMRST